VLGDRAEHLGDRTAVVVTAERSHGGVHSTLDARLRAR
jgi:hypothetical protein